MINGREHGPTPGDGACSHLDTVNFQTVMVYLVRDLYFRYVASNDNMGVHLDSDLRVYNHAAYSIGSCHQCSHYLSCQVLDSQLGKIAHIKATQAQKKNYGQVLGGRFFEGIGNASDAVSLIR